MNAAELSLYSGWTREHWAALADRMLAAIEPYRSPGGARIDLPGPASRNGVVSDGLEGFARTFLLAGFRVAGERGADPNGLLDRYAGGLAAGTEPGSPEAWPRPDTLDQSTVEAASIALVLQLTRPWLWDTLDGAVRDRVVAWLAAVIGRPSRSNNWVWFRLVVETFLREVGGPWSAEDIEADLAVHASLRRPGGWRCDGQERAFDHYTGWVLHLYPLLWSHLFDVTGLCPTDLPAQSARDLSRYLDDAVRLVGADGSPLLQGRSLVYRFAAAAPFWVAAVTRTGALPPGLIRRVASGIVRHVAAAGAPDAAGLLRLGWYHAWPRMRQAYSGPGSPYWAANGMLGLMLPADHPVWTHVERPLPVETDDVARVIAAPGWLLSARRRDGLAVVLNHGTDHARPGDTRADSPLYARLGYSTATVPPLAGATVPDPVDNSVVLLDAADRATHRSGFETLFAREMPGQVLAAASRGPVYWVDTGSDTSPDHGSGRSGPVTPGPVVTVASLLRDGMEVRLTLVESGSPAAQAVRLGGWPVAGDRAPATETGAVSAYASTPTLRSHVLGLRGFTRCGVTIEHDTTPLGAWTAIPWLSVNNVPIGELLAALVVLDRGGPDPRAPTLTVQPYARGHRITVMWADNVRTDITLPLPLTGVS